MAPKTIEVTIKRQEGPGAPPRWEEFSIPYEEGHNGISVLQAIQANPVQKNGSTTTPVAWECCCLEEVCGACSMVINGKVRQACTALVDPMLREDPHRVITFEPMTKFPLIRDLVVDRQRMFDNLIKVKAWNPMDGAEDLGEGPKIAPEKQQRMYPFSECMTCGCCLEACPQINDKSPFIGPSAVGQAYLFNMNPIGQNIKSERLEVLMGPEGLQHCGNAQNCAAVCPKEVPLLEAIAGIGGQLTVHTISKLFTR